MGLMDPGLIAFLFGAGIGFIEDDIIICPHCGCEFPEEDLRYVDDSYACPACMRPLDDDKDDEDHDDN
jgi:hypothetical protein